MHKSSFALREPVQKLRRGSHGKRRGVAAMEMALVLPVLLLVVFGTICVSELIFFRKSMVVAASDGIRLASQRTATSEDVQARITAILASRRITDATITLTPENIDQTAPGDVIELQVVADFDGFSFGVLSQAVLPVTVNSSILRE